MEGDKRIEILLLDVHSALGSTLVTITVMHGYDTAIKSSEMLEAEVYWNSRLAWAT